MPPAGIGEECLLQLLMWMLLPLRVLLVLVVVTPVAAVRGVMQQQQLCEQLCRQRLSSRV